MSNGALKFTRKYKYLSGQNVRQQQSKYSIVIVQMQMLMFLANFLQILIV